MGTDIVSIMIFLQFMRSIPVSLDEAARIDGASPVRIYFRMILPLLKPAIATVVIVKGVVIYNDFYTPFLYMPSPDLGVISTSLYYFKGPYGIALADHLRRRRTRDHSYPGGLLVLAALHLQRLHPRGDEMTGTSGPAPT